jgi:anthranilate phosphoribosyltransferase
VLNRFLEKLVEGQDLDADEAAAVMGLLMEERGEPVQIAALLIAWKMKGETAGEIQGCALALRERAETFGPVPATAVDTCGTGGDGAGTFNISTVAALVAAAAGIPVAKHGNRSVSSRCGSAELLEALGIRPDGGRDMTARCLRETGFAFLFAPDYHRAMQHVAAVRQTLGTRTIFNLLGPLANPARVKRQVLGVFNRRYLEPMAEALRSLGSEHVLVVHSHDGLDELSVCDATDAVELGPEGRPPRPRQFRPEEFGLRRRRPGELAGGEPVDNAGIAVRLLQGETGPCRDAVVLNAGAALYVGGAVDSITAGVDRAAATIDSGAAWRTLERLRELAGGSADPELPDGGGS